MSCCLLPLIHLLARDAAAVDEPAAEPPALTVARETTDAKLRLELAVRAYQAGQYEEARTSLALLVNDPAVTDTGLRQQARIYLGEILYVQGQEDAAFKVFETVLLDDPQHRIDPYRHPPDVCGFFEVVRASMQALETPLSPPPVPVSTRGVWTGFGAWQRAHGRPGLGAFLLGGQVLFGATSIVTFGLLTSDREYEPGSAEERRLEALRAAQWGSTTAFWGLYAWGTLQARGEARRLEREGATTPPLGVGLSGSW